MALRLLSTNSKLNKGNDFGYVSYGLQLLPNTTSNLGNLCPKASASCIATCNAFSGISARMPKLAQMIYDARLERTKLVLHNKNVAEYLIKCDIEQIVTKANKDNKKVAIRLNTFSDLNWLDFIASLRYEFPQVVFYDYTKVYSYLLNKPDNLHLTFSWSGTEENKRDCELALSMGFNVAVPFEVSKAKPMPLEFLDRPVIDGDLNDLRFLDSKNVIVGLKFKKSKTFDKYGIQADNITSASSVKGFVM
jgi:hypothetical protein